MPRGNRQRWCNLCRRELEDAKRCGELEAARADGVKLGFFWFVPTSRDCKSCGRSFTARQPNQVYCGELCRRRTDRPVEAAAARRLKYGGGRQQRVRKAWEPAVATG